MDNRTVLQSVAGRHMPEGALSRKVMLVESEAGVAEMVRGWLSEHGEVTTVMTLGDAILQIPGMKPDVIVLSGLRGVRVAEAMVRLHEVGPGHLMVVLCEGSELEGARKAVPEGVAFRFVLRPPSKDEVVLAVDEALSQASTLKTVAHLAERCRTLESSQARFQQALADYHDRIERTVLMAHKYHMTCSFIHGLKAEVPNLASFAKWSMSQPVAPEQGQARRNGLESLASFCELLEGFHVECSGTKWELRRMRMRIDRLLEEAVERFRKSIGESKCVVRLMPNAQIGSALVDQEWLRESIEQVMRNAVEARGDCTIDINMDYGEGDLVHISIRDNGPGMDPSVLEKAAEPYFTTKSGHTGLGLTVAHRVAQAHGGRLKVISRPGGATTVEIWLPRE